MTNNEQQEEFFFEKASGLDPAIRATLERLRELRNHQGIDVVFKRNGVDDTMRFFVRPPSGSGGAKGSSGPSVFVMQSDGRLMLMGSQNAGRPRVVAALKSLAGAFGQPWTRPNPTYFPEVWGRHVDALEQMLMALTRSENSRPEATSTPSTASKPNLAAAATAEPSAPTVQAPAAAAPGTTPASAKPEAPSAEPPLTPLAPEALDEAKVDWEGIRNDPRQRVQFARWVRLGQPEFRKALLDAYGGACCISGWSPPDVLEAAHIEGHAEAGNNAVQNGLLLRSDLHALFDQGLLRIDPDSFKVVIDDRLYSTAYHREFHGTELRPPKRPEQRPDREKLRAHFNAFAES